MNNKVDKKFKIKFLIIGFFFLTTISFFFTIVYRNYYENTNEYKALVKKVIKGRITDLKDETRGSYYLKIKSFNNTIRLHSLPIAWEVEEFNIQIGDSISKDAKSKKFVIYKQKNGRFKKICEFEM